MKTALDLGEPSETTSPAFVLIGPPGVGKTAIGKLLAERLELKHKDSDDAVVARSGLAIPEIFAQYGEPEFRRLEADSIAELLTGFAGVLSLGGGAVMTPQTQQALAEYSANGGLVVYLDMDAETAGQRLVPDGRPLLSGDDPLTKWQQLSETRRPTYARVSDFRVDTSRQTPFRVVGQILVYRDAGVRGSR